MNPASDKASRQRFSSRDLGKLDEGEPSWRGAILGFLVIFIIVGLFFFFWIALFNLRS